MSDRPARRPWGGGRWTRRHPLAAPALSGIGFIPSGLAGVLAAPTLAYMRSNRPFRTLAAIVLVAAGLIWALTAYGVYWGHIQSFLQWQPLITRAAAGPP